MDLAYEFSYHADLAEPLMVGAGPRGTRIVVPVTGGRVKGERIKGSFIGGGGDWLLLGADGWARLDVRGQIQTDDGALVYITYQGLLQVTEGVQAAIATMDQETGFDDQYFRTTPCLETGDERYAWVNQTLFVAKGRLVPGGVEYEVSRVT